MTLFERSIQFEDGLTVGTPVTIRWTNSSRFYAAPGRVARINAKSFTVALDAVPTGTSYVIGQSINAPRFASNSWSTHNRVAPLEQYVGELVG